jgi:hypothetical protein
MPDISAITSGLSALKTATAILKEIRKANKSLQDAEIKLKLADLSEALAEAKMKLADAQQEILDLKSIIAELKESHDFRKQIKKEGNVYVPIGKEVDGYGTGPWCTNCYETKGVLISLHHKVAAAMALGSGRGFTSYKWECPNCKNSVSAPKR